MTQALAELAPEAATETAAASVAVAYVHSDSVAASWSWAMLNLSIFDAANGGRVARGGSHPVQFGADGMSGARNRAVVQALRGSAAEFLFWTDTDMGFAPDTVNRLAARADADAHPIVGGLCFAAKYGLADGLGGWQIETHPTIYDWHVFGDGSQGFMPVRDYPKDQLVPCGGTGSACVLIHRSVFSKIEKHFGSGVWYDRMINESSGQLLSEDLSFCRRAAEVDCPIWIDTAVKTTHAKTVWVGEEFYQLQRGAL